MGGSWLGSLDGIAVADIPAHGNARHDDEWVTAFQSQGYCYDEHDIEMPFRGNIFGLVFVCALADSAANGERTKRTAVPHH